MTPQQSDHLHSIITSFTENVIPKYEQGAREHDDSFIGDMTTEQLLDEAINEAIDQFVYLWTMKQKMRGEL